jgi:hypothetical protein
MTRIVFYRHERADGGLRTGVEVDGNSVFESFREGVAEHDPALIWYIDIEFEGSALPDSGDTVRQWLLDNSAQIRRTVDTLSHEIAAGFDPELRPFRRTIQNWCNGVSFTATASAIDRAAARGTSQKLAEIAENWEATLTALEPLVGV